MARTIIAHVTVYATGGRPYGIYPTSKMYRPHLVPSGSESMLGVQFENGPEFIGLGETGRVEMRCLYELSYDALQPGVRFEIREGPKAIGEGVVIEARP